MESNTALANVPGYLDRLAQFSRLSCKAVFSLPRAELLILSLFSALGLLAIGLITMSLILVR